MVPEEHDIQEPSGDDPGAPAEDGAPPRASDWATGPGPVVDGADPLGQSPRDPSKNRPGGDSGADPLGQSPRDPSENRPGGDPPSSEEAPPVDEVDYKDRYLRTAAELDNIRKRARRDVGTAEARGVARLAKELLPALDNLDRALAAVEAADADGDHEMTRGIRLVQKELVGALERVGIVPDVPAGEAFDPHRHEAVAQMPSDQVASGMIIEVYQAGYRHGEDVLRAAKVVVAQ